jgi:RNA-directed DNA polymerase
MRQMIQELSRYLRGWRGYFGYCETSWVLENLDSWVRRRVRRAFWWQSKTRRKRPAELLRLGANPDLAARAAGSHSGSWRVSGIPALHQALSNAYLASLGLVSVAGGH